MTANQQLPRGSSVASIALYTLAAIAFAIGAYLGIAFLSAPAALETARIAFGTPQILPLINLISSGMQMIGVTILIGGLALGALLVAAGMSLRRSSALAQRVARLEAALERAAAR